MEMKIIRPHRESISENEILPSVFFNVGQFQSRLRAMQWLSVTLPGNSAKFPIDIAPLKFC